MNAEGMQKYLVTEDQYAMNTLPVYRKQFRKLNIRPASENDQNADPNRYFVKPRCETYLNQDPPTFGNWNKDHLNIPKSRSVKLSAQIKQKNQISRSSSRHKPRFPRNNKIIKQFINQEQPIKFTTIEATREFCHSNQKIPLRKLTERSNISYNIENVSPFQIKEAQLQNKFLKERFKKIYIKQKAAYQKILKRYGIEQTVGDQQFNKLMNFM